MNRDTLYIDPWAHEAIPLPEYVERVRARAEEAGTLHYRLRRAWARFRGRPVPPSRARLMDKADMLEIGAFEPLSDMPR